MQKLMRGKQMTPCKNMRNHAYVAYLIKIFYANLASNIFNIGSVKKEMQDRVALQEMRYQSLKLTRLQQQFPLVFSGSQKLR